METAIFAGGCFWCTEAIFKRLKGVESVDPGYSGGNSGNPDYEQVSKGSTGHAEAIRIRFDKSVISYEKLVEIFFKLHDPTTLNQQGADIGTQYRSVIFYNSEDQRKTAETIKRNLEEKKVYRNPIVTEITPFKAFYEAEEYHRDYYDNNRGAGYCRVVIDPKITKLYREYKDVVRQV